MCNQHQEGTTDGTGRTITDKKGRVFPIWDKSVKPKNQKTYFIKGKHNGQTYAFSLSIHKRSKPDKCGAPDGGTQTDDRPQSAVITAQLSNNNLEGIFSVISKEEQEKVLKKLSISFKILGVAIIECKDTDATGAVYILPITLRDSWNSDPNNINKIGPWSYLEFKSSTIGNINIVSSITNVNNGRWQ